jgi:hypothetical protein
MRDHEIIGLQEAYLEVCEEGRSARRRKPSKSVEQLKAEISARDEAKAQRATERAAARRPLTPGEKYDQEKATKKDKSSDFSRHRMTGSGGHGSEYRVPSRFKEEFVVNYLLDEGFASDEKSAEAILGAMSEAWVDSIFEKFELAADPSKPQSPKPTKLARKRKRHDDWEGPDGETLKGRMRRVVGTQRRQDTETGVTN